MVPIEKYEYGLVHVIVGQQKKTQMVIICAQVHVIAFLERASIIDC